MHPVKNPSSTERLQATERFVFSRQPVDSLLLNKKASYTSKGSQSARGSADTSDSSCSEESIEAAVVFAFTSLKSMPSEVLAREALASRSFLDIQSQLIGIGITSSRAGQIAREAKEGSWIERGVLETKVKGLQLQVGEVGIRVVYNNFLVDIKSGVKFTNPDVLRLSKKEIQKIHDFVIKNKKCLKQQMLESGEEAYLSSKETSLARSIQFTKEGEVFLHFNKKSKAPIKDRTLGTGTYKVVTTAMELFSFRKLASLSMSVSEAENELYFSNFLKEGRGFLAYEHKVVYESPKSGEIKARLLSPIYDRGSLYTLIEQKVLSMREKELIIYQLIRSVVFMHNKGILHRDLKPENFLVRGQGENIEVVIADFGHAMHETDKYKKKWCVGTFNFFAPEYIDRKISVACATTTKLDIWALGVSFDEVLYEGCRMMAPRAVGSGKESDAPVLSYVERKEPSYKMGLAHLVWQMLRKNPSDRISTEGLQQWLEKREKLSS